MTLDRKRVFPEAELPDWRELVAEGRKLAATVTVGRSLFLDHYGVASESDYKRRAMADRRLMFHGQIGFREAEKSRRAYAEIHDQLAKRGYRVDRYGICLDWSMGYPAARRANMPRGTGLIMRGVEDFVAMTAMAPVAPHFGDFVIGTPASLENTAAALHAGSTSIGNLGQYFTFRQPHWDDDVQVTAESIKAIAHAAAQPVEVLVHSNLDDGFAALFTDLACSLGAILIEKHLIEGLLGGRVGHCFGNTFSKPFARLAFQRAAARATDTPGTMVYGATTMYGASHSLNFAALANYLRLDIAGQRSLPTGHAVNPVPVTEAERIPDIDEVIDAHLFANRIAELEEPLAPLIDYAAADAVADRIVEGGRRFKERVFAGLAEAGIDVANPFELMLAIRRIGSKRLEESFGPGAPESGRLRGRAPVVRSTSIEAMEEMGEGFIAALEPGARESIRAARFRACLATTDVHEYGKILVETVLRGLGAEVIDGGVSTDPNDLAARAHAERADFVALSSYNGVALGFIAELRGELERLGLDLPLFVGGKLNQVPEASNTSLPVDVSADLAAAGAVVCKTVDDMLARLATMAAGRAVRAGT